MKISKALLSFPMKEGAPTVKLWTPDTPYSVTYDRVPHPRIPGKYAVRSEVTPEQYRDPATFEGDMPDGLEMLVGQGELFIQSIAHYLECEDHRPIVRTEIALMHEELERHKVKYPHLAEMTIMSQLCALAAGVPMALVHVLGLLNPAELESKPNELEETLLNSQNNEGMDASDVVLDYECVVPMPTDAEREAHAAAIASQKNKPCHTPQSFNVH